MTNIKTSLSHWLEAAHKLSQAGEIWMIILKQRVDLEQVAWKVVIVQRVAKGVQGMILEA